MHIYIYTCIYTHTHMYIYTYINTLLYICILTHGRIDNTIHMYNTFLLFAYQYFPTCIQQICFHCRLKNRVKNNLSPFALGPQCLAKAVCIVNAHLLCPGQLVSVAGDGGAERTSPNSIQCFPALSLTCQGHPSSPLTFSDLVATLRPGAATQRAGMR